MPEVFADVGHCVDAVLHRVGPRIVLALPLGIGKPNPLVNEFYRRALRDPAIDLTLVTALSLLKPVARSALEARLLTPLVERVFGSYVEPEYARAMQHDALPENIRVLEFFLAPGAFLGSRHAQRHYLSANYTHVAREVLARGVNVIAHLLARRTVNGELQLSLGSNPDVTVDLLPLIAAARTAGRDIVMVGETHGQMPFMSGCAQVDAQRFDFLVDDPRYDYDLFCPPNPALHQQNAAWRSALAALGGGAGVELARMQGGDEPFAQGLFAATEMFVDQLLELYRAGILRRRVYDSTLIERALASGEVSERCDERLLERLAGAGAGPVLSAAEFADLKRHGVFREDVEYLGGRVRARGGAWIDAALADPANRARLAAECLGQQLANGQVLHAGFFLGPRGFYAALRELPDGERAQFGMRGVAFVNQLYGEDQELRILQRRDARCINTTMMVTLLGAAVSDQLADGKVVSGVGGQYNFVAMAHALPGARSILCVRATRTRHGRTTSNILWNYAHETIPRHLRDIVITEYGIADLRGRTDEEIIAALLNIADSRFQHELLAQARAAGKIGAGYRIPEAHRHNLPRRLSESLADHRREGYFSEYPFGTDLSAEEIALVRALSYLGGRTGNVWGRLTTVLAALVRGRPSGRHAAALRRMGLERPRVAGERLEQRLVVLGLDATAGGAGAAR